MTTIYSSKNNKMKEKSSILITGGGGFIGHHLVNYLLKQDKYVITVVDNFSTGDYKNIRDLKEVKLILGDFTDPNLLLDISDGKYQNIVHLAATANVKQCEEDPVSSFYNNCLNTQKLLHACSSKKVDKLVFASSCAVYGNNGPSFPIEDVVLDPISQYGLQKEIGEKMCVLSGKNFKNGISCLRFFNVFGERQKHGVVVSWSKILAYAIKNNTQAVELRVNGNPSRDYIYVGDVCESIAKALTKTFSSTEDVGCGDSISLEELKNLMIEVSGYQGDVKIVKYEANDYDPFFVEVVKPLQNIKPKNRKQKLKQTFESYLKETK